MFEPRLASRLATIAENVYPNVAPENYATPAVVYQLLDSDPVNDLDGFGDETFVTVQLAISSTKFGEAKALARSIRRDLANWNDDKVVVLSWLNEVVAVDNSTDTTLYRVVLFFRFWVTD